MARFVGVAEVTLRLRIHPGLNPRNNEKKFEASLSLVFPSMTNLLGGPCLPVMSCILSRETVRANCHAG